MAGFEEQANALLHFESRLNIQYAVVKKDKVIGCVFPSFKVCLQSVRVKIFPSVWFLKVTLMYFYRNVSFQVDEIITDKGRGCHSGLPHSARYREGLWVLFIILHTCMQSSMKMCKQ